MNKFFALVILLSLAIVGCQDESKISDDIQPEKDKLQVYKVDTISFDVSTFSPDSILSSGLTNFMFGGYRDDIFGMTKGHFVSQLRFTTIAYLDTIPTRDSVVLDSLFFIIPYTDYVGDSMLANEVTVYELQQSIDNQTIFYSNTELETLYDQNKPLGSLYYRVKSEDNIIDYYLSSGAPIYGLKVPLDMELAQRLFDNIDLYKNDLAAFQDFFKGMVAVSTFGSKSLIMVNPLLYDSYLGNRYYKCRMRMNYHDEREDFLDSLIVDMDTTFRDTIIGGIDTQIVEAIDTIYGDPFIRNVKRYQDYYVNNECGRFSILEHNFEGAKIENVDVNDPAYPYSFLRGGGALRIRIKMPHFREHPSFQPLSGQDTARIAVNSAKLILKIDPDAININKITPPGSIVAFVDNGEDISIIEDLKYGSAYFGGTLNLTNFTYEINIGEYVQNSIDAKEDNQEDIIIAVSSDAISPFFTLIGKPTHRDIEKQMEFSVVYTRY